MKHSKRESILLGLCFLTALIIPFASAGNLTGNAYFVDGGTDDTQVTMGPLEAFDSGLPDISSAFTVNNCRATLTDAAYSGSSFMFNYTASYDTNLGISGIRHNLAVVNLRTHNATNTTIRYGTNISVNETYLNTSILSLHNITILSLKNNTLYYYNITSCDGSMCWTFYILRNFTTLETWCGDNDVQATNAEGVSEVCDGTDLNGESCSSLGYVQGTLACNSCAWETSACQRATGSSSSSTSSKDIADNILADINETMTDFNSISELALQNSAIRGAIISLCVFVIGVAVVYLLMKRPTTQ